MRTLLASASASWLRSISKWSIGWVVSVLLLLPLVCEAQSSPSNCSTTSNSLLFFVPHEHDRSLVKVTFNNLWTDAGQNASGRATFVFCCEWAWPGSADDLEARLKLPPKDRNLNCSILSTERRRRRIAWTEDFCLHVRSSSKTSNIVGGGNAGRGCALRADAAVSLSLYLAKSSSSFRSVQTQAECVGNDVPCRLTITGTTTAAGESSPKSKLKPEVLLGAVEWTGNLSSDSKHVNQAHEYYKVVLENPRKLFSPHMFDIDLSISPPLASRLVDDAFQFKGRRTLQQQSGRVPKAARLGLGLQEWRVVVAMLMSLAGISMVAVLCAGKKEGESPTEFLDTVAILPPRFSYSKLQKATRNFSQKLGDGAFGSVFEGTLLNGIRVAVKMLEKASVQGEKQFRAEVASMGAIRHLNLVRLHGFCSEGSHRLLVYEFMPNGSLDSWLFGKKQGEKLLDWEQRLNIALGTARALAYLHEECSDHIIHLDVKPENILLDHQFCPKLSDFGLAKLMDREQSRVVTSMRGTPGYLAPEWLLPQAAVTAKTDVYSFGMVLLELISGRENTNFSLGKEQWYFPAWAFKLMSEGRTMELLDKRLHVEEVEYFHKEDSMRAIHVALLCIQDDPAARPSMSRVVHMLQGHVEPEPLNARQSAINPPPRLVTAFAASSIDTTNLQKEQCNQPKSDCRSREDSRSSREDSRKNSWSNEQDPILSELQREMRNDHQMVHRTASAATTPVISSSTRLPAVTESPRVHDQQPKPPRAQQLPPDDVDSFRLEPALPPAAAAVVQSASQYRSSKVDKLAAGAHSHLGGPNPKCIPPWPVTGDVILCRSLHGDFHAVVRDVRVQTKQMRLGLLHRASSSSDTRWSVRDEESVWRHWNESIRTLDFWVVVRWAALPGRGFERFPVEWQVR